MVLGRRGVQENWLIFKDHFLQAQEQSISLFRKSSRRGRRPTWMNKEHVTAIKQEKKVYRRWKQGQVTKDEYREGVQGWGQESKPTWR